MNKRNRCEIFEGCLNPYTENIKINLLPYTKEIDQSH